MVEDLPQRGAGSGELAGKVKHLRVAVVAHDQALMGIIHADALRLIVQRRVELDALLSEILYDDGSGAADGDDEHDREPDQE